MNLDTTLAAQQGNLSIRVVYVAPEGRSFGGGQSHVSHEFKTYISPTIKRDDPTQDQKPEKKQDTPPEKPPLMVAEEREKTIQDSLDLWLLVLADPTEYEIREMESGVEICIKNNELAGGLHDVSYRTITISPDDEVCPDEMEPLKHGILLVVHAFREKLREQERIKGEKEQETKDYLEWTQTLMPYWECLRDMSGTEGLTEDFFGGSVIK